MVIKIYMPLTTECQLYEIKLTKLKEERQFINHSGEFGTPLFNNRNNKATTRQKINRKTER